MKKNVIIFKTAISNIFELCYNMALGLLLKQQLTQVLFHHLRF